MSASNPTPEQIILEPHQQAMLDAIGSHSGKMISFRVRQGMSSDAAMETVKRQMEIMEGSV